MYSINDLLENDVLEFNINILVFHIFKYIFIKVGILLKHLTNVEGALELGKSKQKLITGG